MKKTLATIAGIVSLGAGGAAVTDQQINPYVDKQTHYELGIKGDIQQGERVDISKTEAAMTLRGWNDEYAITIKPQIPSAVDKPFTVPANRPLLSKREEYQSGDVTAFIESKTASEFDIDFTLNSKPVTNVFDYKITGAEDFNFFYQPALTNEEIAEGVVRPDNVVGSYAVYHKTKVNHIEGSTNYANGKAFHIFRPKAIDANGAETWATLSYVDGTLSVTVPQDFLDTATYPVRIDPTFGYTTAGGSSTAFNSGTNAVANMVAQYTASSGDSVTQYSVYGSGGVTIGMTTYSVVAGSPSARLAAETAFNMAAVAGWSNSATVSQSLTAGVTYCVALRFNASNGTFYWDAGTAPGRINSTSSALLDPFGATGTDSGRHYSWYATYVAGGGGGTPPVRESVWDDE